MPYLLADGVALEKSKRWSFLHFHLQISANYSLSSGAA
jgi:hypothetical protein